MSEINTNWFRAKLAYRQLSIRGLAKQMGLDPSAVSLMLRGRREMKMHEAARIADILCVPIGEILRNAGIKMPKQFIQITGYIDGNGEVFINQPPAGVIEASQGTPARSFAIEAKTAGSTYGYMDRGVFICEQINQDCDSGLGMQCLVKIKNGPVLIGHLGRGYNKGTYSLMTTKDIHRYGQFNTMQDNLNLEWVSLVIEVLRHIPASP